MVDTSAPFETIKFLENIEQLRSGNSHVRKYNGLLEEKKLCGARLFA